MIYLKEKEMIYTLQFLYLCRSNLGAEIEVPTLDGTIKHRILKVLRQELNLDLKIKEYQM